MADQPVTREKLINADKDVQVIEDFIKKPKDETVTTRFGDEIMTLKGLEEEVKKSGGYFKRYTSLAAANADIANIPVDGVVKVTSAVDGGDYEKVSADATSLTKSSYDSAKIAKQETLSEIIDRSSNLFNKNTVLLNTSVESDGSVVSDASRWLSDFIECIPSQVFSLTLGSYRIAYYDANKNFLSRTTPSNVSTFTTPSNAAVEYLRLSSTLSLNTQQLNTGATLLPYQPYYERVKNKLIPDVTPEKLPVIAPTMTDFFKLSSNKFNKNSIQLNTSVESDGSVVSDASRWLSDFIECIPSQVFSLTLGSYRIAYYDANKNFLSRTTPSNVSTFTTPSNAAVEYLRLSSTISAEGLMLNTGSALLSYEEYGKSLIKKEHIPGVEAKELPVIKPEMTDFFHVGANIFNKGAVLLNTSIGTDGVIGPDTAGRWLSDYIAVSPGEKITMTDAAYRVAAFDSNKNFLLRTGVVKSGLGYVTYTAGSSPRFIRLSSTEKVDDVMVNRGEVLLPLDSYGEVRLKSEYAPNMLPDIDQISDEIQQRIGSGLNWEPSFPKLNFSIVESGTWRTPMWMSSDGVVIYGAYGGQLLQSTDEWTTRVQIGATNLPKSIAGIRTLDDGELLISTNRDEATATNSKVYKTIGYDRNNPSAATFKEVLTTAASQANINNRWGLTVYQNICTASDYGLRGENGAQNVYLSTDYGETWRLIFNLRTQVVEGRPPLTDSAHMHTVAYDPYFNRIWVCTGDNPNTATYYSDDLGETWTFVLGSTEVQYTGIIALPDAVVFGSDRAPNGVFAYQRKDRSEMPVIKPLFLINDSPTITHVFALPFKKDWFPNTPVYFAGNKTTESVNDKPVIIGFIDGKKAHLLYEHSGVDALETALGPTAQGNIISSYSTSGVAGQVIIKAKAPTWQKL